MLIVLQLILFCALYIGLVKLYVPHRALEGIFFYPAEFQARAVEKGLVSKEYIDKRKKLFMVPFMLAILAALVLIIGLWNGVRDFGTAYWQAVLFLEVVNWFDGIVIDELWVGHSKFWVIPGMEGEPYVKPWSFMLKKRSIGSIAWLAIAAIVAGLVVLIF